MIVGEEQKTQNGAAVAVVPAPEGNPAENKPAAIQSVGQQVVYPEDSTLSRRAARTLNALRIEMLDLRTHLLYMDENSAEGAAITTGSQAYIAKTYADIHACLEKTYTLLNEDDAAAQQAGAAPSFHFQEGNRDSIMHLVNIWEELQNRDLFKAQNQVLVKDDLKLTIAELNRAIFQISVLTIPNQLSGWLRESRTGYYIPFHELFSEQLPDENDRNRMLKYFTWAPKLLRGGLLDLDRGLIYRYAESRVERYMSMVVILALFGVCTLIVIAAAVFPIGPASTPALIAEERMSKLIVAWIALLVGIVVHVAISMVKGSKPPIIAIGELSLLISARSGQILIKIVIALFALFGMVFTFGLGELSMATAFLTGYSLDSFTGIFASTLDKQAATQSAAVATRLGVSGPET